MCVVGERSQGDTSHTGRSGGLERSDYAGISSDKSREKRDRRKPKVSWGRLIRPGLVGPKPRLKSVGDGQQVKIFLHHPRAFLLSGRSAMGGRRAGDCARSWKRGSKLVGGLSRQIRTTFNSEK